MVIFGCSQFVSARYEECEIVDDSLFNGGHVAPIDWNMNGGLLIVEMLPSKEKPITLSYQYPDSIVRRVNSLLEQVCGSRHFSVRGANDVLPMPYNETELIEYPCLIEGSIDRHAEHDQYHLCPGSYCNDVLYLECLEEDHPTEDWQLDGAGLYRAHEDHILQDDEGLLLVHLSNGRNKGVLGTVCDDNFNDHAADLACQYLGFDGAADWGSSPKNAEYLPNNILENNDVDTVVDDLTCSGDERNITDCQARVMHHDCSRSQNVWLKCGSDYSDWEFTRAQLLRYNEDSDEVKPAPEGLLLVQFSSRSGNDYATKIGTVCDDGWDDHAANLACQYLGCDFARDWGSDPENERFLPSRILDLHQAEILVDDIHCSSSADDIEECEAIVLEGHDCARHENLWLSCGNDEDDEDGGVENVAGILWS